MARLESLPRALLSLPNVWSAPDLQAGCTDEGESAVMYVWSAPDLQAGCTDEGESAVMYPASV